MKSHRIIIYIGVLLAAAAAVLPSPALASSLLSGYGGPGQGSQAILGSALLNGPKGGGGSGGSGDTAGGASAIAGSGTGSSANGSGSSPSAGKGALRATREGSRHAAGKGERAAAKTAPAGRQGFYPAAERVPSGADGGTLGLSGADLVYIILAVAILVSLGLLTRRTARQREGAGN